MAHLGITYSHSSTRANEKVKHYVIYLKLINLKLIIKVNSESLEDKKVSGIII